MSKCKCVRSPGYTTVKCCNLCGLPIKGESWHIQELNELEAENKQLTEALIRERVKIGKVTEKGIEIEGGIVVSGTVQNVDIGNLRHGENIYLSPDVPGGIVGDMQLAKSLLATMSPEKRLELGYADPEQVKTMKDKIRRLHNEIDDLENAYVLD